MAKLCMCVGQREGIKGRWAGQRERVEAIGNGTHWKTLASSLDAKSTSGNLDS